MSEPARLDGVVRAFRYDPTGGKQFLGAWIECGDGTQWILSYDEQSPLHAFADRRVIALGAPNVAPGAQQLISLDRSRPLGHFGASSVRVVEVPPDVGIVEVGPEERLSGRFERCGSGEGAAPLRFVTEHDAFWVVNDPAGVKLECPLEVRAYPVQQGASVAGHADPWRWIICPYSMADLWEWRERGR